jgi:hypothetical protein
MAKKLFRVRVDLYVMAEDEVNARLAATRAKFDIFECTAREAEALLSGWENAIPYNSDDERTCSEIFAAKKPVPGRAISIHPHQTRSPRMASFQH